MAEILTYSSHWKDLGSVLAYIHAGFAFNTNVIITELDDCICKKITIAKLYDIKNKASIEFDDQLLKKLIRENTNCSIVILSNQLNHSKLTIDSIKIKLEAFVERTKIQVLAFFALKQNSFCKPHTGLWRLLTAYYKRKSLSISKVTIVSNYGGTIVVKERKETISESVEYSDCDRAFANNISCDFMTVSEYTECVESRLLPKTKQVVKFLYNHSIIQPEIRELYANELDKKTNINIFKELGTMSVANYLIIILGPPRSGKTTLTNEIISKWRNSSYGDYNAVEVLYGSGAKRLINSYKKTIANRISVVLDGCDLASINTYIKIAESHSAGVLAVIIDCGIEMAKVLNHVYVEESTNENDTVVKLQDYCIYRSKFTAPSCKYVMYYPKIDRRNTVMKFRY